MRVARDGETPLLCRAPKNKILALVFASRNPAPAMAGSTSQDHVTTNHSFLKDEFDEVR